MGKFIVRSFLFVYFLVMNNVLFAQDSRPAMADVMRSNGKIYIVVAVCLIILIGLFIYVMMIDRKIKKMEKGE